MAVLDDNFDSYSTGDLNGQGNWTATAGFGVVQTSVVEGGANAVIVDTWAGSKTIDNAITAVTSGTQSFYFRVTAGNVNLMYVQFRETGSALRFAVRTSGGTNTLEVYNGTSFNDTGFSISVDTWYKVTVDFTSTQVRAKLDAGSYSSFYTLGTTLTGGIVQIHVDDSNPTGTLYLDTFVDENNLSSGNSNFFAFM